MVDGTCWIGKFSVAKDGIHVNRRRAKKFGDHLCKVHILLFSGKCMDRAGEVAERNTHSGLCINIILTSEV
jgi:hypothetical protein